MKTGINGGFAAILAVVAITTAPVAAQNFDVNKATAPAPQPTKVIYVTKRPVTEVHPTVHTTKTVFRNTTKVVNVPVKGDAGEDGAPGPAGHVVVMYTPTIPAATTVPAGSSAEADVSRVEYPAGGPLPTVTPLTDGKVVLAVPVEPEVKWYEKPLQSVGDFLKTLALIALLGFLAYQGIKLLCGWVSSITTTRQETAAAKLLNETYEKRAALVIKTRPARGAETAEVVDHTVDDRGRVLGGHAGVHSVGVTATDKETKAALIAAATRRR